MPRPDELPVSLLNIEISMITSEMVDMAPAGSISITRYFILDQLIHLVLAEWRAQ